MIEIFAQRMEITNPGGLLVDIARMLDNPPQSRNDTLASFMRRAGFCEERGSGIDKVVSATETYQLPAPMFEAIGDSTRAILFAHRPLSQMDKNDRTPTYSHTYQLCFEHFQLHFFATTPVQAL